MSIVPIAKIRKSLGHFLALSLTFYGSSFIEVPYSPFGILNISLIRVVVGLFCLHLTCHPFFRSSTVRRGGGKSIFVREVPSKSQKLRSILVGIHHSMAVFSLKFATIHPGARPSTLYLWVPVWPNIK